MKTRAQLGLFLAFCSSVAAHGAAYASLPARHERLPRGPRVSEMNFELPPLPELLPEPERPQRVPESAALRSDPPARAAAHIPPAKSAAQAAPPATTSPPPALDFSGVTLTNETGLGFAMPVGNGSPLQGPIALGAPQAVTGNAPSPSPAPAKPPALVNASDLSEHPRPPDLAGLLRANYPEEARLRGLRGSARVRARIEADGVIRSARLLFESAAGFGSACRHTVLGSRWSAPRDKNGAAVATEIVYTCHFEVDQ